MWRWTTRYWSVVAGALMVLPLWVALINVENGLSASETLGLAFSFFPCSFGLGLALAMRWLNRTARSDAVHAGYVGEQLGISLGAAALFASLGSLVTMDGRFFVGGLVLLLLPAGLLAGTSSELASAATSAPRPAPIDHP